MSEQADSDAHTCEENSHATLNAVDLEKLPPRTIEYTGRRPRFGTGNVPLSPYILIDGRKLRSSLAFTKKWPPRRVSFPTNDNDLVTGYLEPANPWELAENVNRQVLISAYKESCVRHNTDPLESVLGQLENIEVSEHRCEQLNLKGAMLDQNHSEPLEEILKRVQFNKIDLEGTSLDDVSSVILFDMLEYYESARYLNISSNQDIGIRGWEACAHMIKKTRCLEQLEAKDVTLNEQYMSILSRALRLVSHLHVLKLENCGLSGRAMVILVKALKMNTGIKELYLADNGLDLYDAIQLGSLLRLNNHVQLLDVSNNNIQDDGVRDILLGLTNQVDEDKDGKGLNILILWNNRLTQKSAPYFCRLISHSKTVETLNIGQNALTNELLYVMKEALKKNRVLLQLGMQSTELTCDGIVTLSEIISTNQGLQRIDLRDNTIQVTGVRALTNVMKNNKNITQIDLDDKPRIRIQDGTLHDYMELVAEIRGYCTENEKNRTLEESSDGSVSPQHYSRFCSASSRKISLTCQTLPCSSPSTTPVQSDEQGRSMLEPKRASGGRLRSPAPSPIPSPIASPIPSPSRSRFVVSRVPEASLRSTDSSASSSPVTPPSLGSSPTCFFPSASGSSRFRVSLVESAKTVPSPKSVVTSTKGNVTIGFSFKLDTIESADSDDSDNVFKGELERNNDLNSSSTPDAVTRIESCSVPDVVICETNDTSTHAIVKVSDSNTRNSSAKNPIVVDLQDNRNSVGSIKNEHCDVRDNQPTAPIELEGAVAVVTTDSIKDNCNESTKYIETAMNINEDNIDSSSILTADKSTSVSKEYDATSESGNDASFPEIVKKESQENQNSTVQKHTSNLEKLLELFQHPGSFFSDSTSINPVETKSTFQDSVSSIMAFGDKFHHYLKEGREKVVSHGTWSTDESSPPAKSKSVKSTSISQLTGFQSLSNMFSSFKLDANLNLFEQSTTKSGPKAMEHEGVINSSEAGTEDNLTDMSEVKSTGACTTGNRGVNVYSTEGEIHISASTKQSLPDDVQSKTNDGHTSKDLALEESRIVVPTTTVDTCSKTVHTSPLSDVPESKTTVCIPMLTNLPEYSVLEVTGSNVKSKSVVEVLEEVESVVVGKTCDRTLTDSINPTSDSNSSSCNISCDIRGINDVNTVLETTTESTQNSVRVHLNMKQDVKDSTVLDIPNDTPSFVSDKEPNYNVNNSLLVCQVQTKVDVRKNECLSNEVTSTDNRGIQDKEILASLNEMTIKSANETDTCHVDNLTHQNSTIVNNNTSELRVHDVSLIVRNNSDVSCVDTDARRNVSTRTTEDSIETLKPGNPEGSAVTEDELSKRNNNSQSVALTETAEAYYAIESTVDNTAVKTSESTSVPTFIFTHHKISSNASTEKGSSLAEAEKSDTEDLIFCMTDISTDGASIDDELSPATTTSSNWSTGSNKSTTPLYELPQTSRSPTSLLIERPEQMHRNSQDSGIGESTLSAAEDNISEVSHTYSRGSFQESIDSGIDSECSAVYVKSETCVEVSKEDVSYIDEHTNNRSNEHTSSDIREITHLQTTHRINSTTIETYTTIEGPTCSGIGEPENVPIGFTDDSTTAVPEASALIARATSPKHSDDEDEEEEENEELGTAEELDFVDEEISDLDDVALDLEPRYQRYARWRI